MTLPLLTFDKRASGVQLDLNQLIVSRLLIQANSGGGKSHAVRYMIEQNFGKVQQIVIDPEGEFATLREKYPFLLVGRDGDVPADIRGAKLLAKKLLELDLSAVIDLSEFGLPQQRLYVHAFTQALNHLPRELWKDCLIYYDEVHRWAPEVGKSSGKEVQPLKEEIATLQSAGRKRGFCGIMATQRLSKLDKDVAAECLNKLIGRTSNEDIKRAGGELGLSKLQGKELRSLDPGTFWTYGPAVSIDPVLVRTGAIVTHPPKRGAARAPAPAAPGAIKKVLAELADLPQEAVEEARTVQDLQRKNAELTSRIRQAEKGMATKTVEKPVVDQAAIDREVKRALVTAQREFQAKITHLRKALEQAMKFMINISAANFDVAGVDKTELERAVTAAVTKAAGMVEQRLEFRKKQLDQLRLQSQQIAANLRKLLADETPVEINVAVQKNDAFTVSAKPAPAIRDREVRRHTAVDGIKPGQQRILNAIAELEAIGVPAPSRAQLGMVASYNLTGGSGAQHLADLGSAGYVETGAGTVQLTDAGRSAADVGGAPTSLSELHERVLAKLSSGQRRIAEHLISIYPEPISRADLGAAVNYNLTGGSGAQHLADLVNVGAVSIPGKGAVVASKLLFPEALS